MDIAEYVDENKTALKSAFAEAAIMTDANASRLHDHIDGIVKDVKNGNFFDNLKCLSDEEVEAWRDAFQVIEYVGEKKSNVDLEEVSIYEYDYFMRLAKSLSQKIEIGKPTVASLLATKTPLPKLNIKLPKYFDPQYEHEVRGGEIILGLPVYEDGEVTHWAEHRIDPVELEQKYYDTYKRWTKATNIDILYEL